MIANEKSVLEDLLQELDPYELKQQDVCDIVKELIAAYKNVVDERNVAKTEDELKVVIKETNRDVDTEVICISTDL